MNDCSYITTRIPYSAKAYDDDRRAHGVPVGAIHHRRGIVRQQPTTTEKRKAEEGELEQKKPRIRGFLMK